jgi:menaquinone-dependent protoporphyrinogen IX oxidase
MNAQIIYYSKYGSTKEIAHSIQEKLGAEHICDVRDLSDISADLLIIGSSIYKETSHKEILRLLKDNDRLKDKAVALFVVCLSRKLVKTPTRDVGGPVYLRQLEEALGRESIATQIFGGRMIPAEMEEEERINTEINCQKRGMPFGDIDLMNEQEVDEFVSIIKAGLKR